MSTKPNDVARRPGATDDPWKVAFASLVGFISASRDRDSEKDFQEAQDRAYAYGLALAYAEGILENRGMTMADLGV